MPENLTTFYLMTALVAIMIGLSKGGLGGLMGAMATPLMALVMPADQVIGLLLPVLMIADLFAVASHWRKWDWRHIKLLLPGALIGVVIGTLFIRNAPTQALRVLIGVITLLFTIYKLFEGRLKQAGRYRSRDWHGLLGGTVAGFSSSVAHTGGPPVSIYMLLQDMSPRVFVATTALFFALLNWMKVPFYAYSGLFDFSQLISILWLLPLLPLGVLAGRWLAVRINKVVFERVITFLLAITALMLIFG
jgi:uncharacterized protein